MKNNYDVIIVGGGPAGLFAAYELSDSFDVAIFEMGNDIKNRQCPEEDKGYCTSCHPCNITSGIGGGGGLSDGKLIYPNEKYSSSLTVGGNFLDYVSKEKTIEKMKQVEKIFRENGADKEIYGLDDEKVNDLLKKANIAGIDFIPLIQTHVGSDNMPGVIYNLESEIKKKNADFYTRREVSKIDHKNKKIFTANGESFGYDQLILAVGRTGASKLGEWIDEIGIEMEETPEARSVDVGIRVEVPNSIMEDVTKINYDPKFRMKSRRDDYIRTFCTCPEGWVIRENYEDFSLVNGHSKYKEKSNNTNFALLNHTTFTDPFKKPNEWGKNLGKLTTKLGGGDPIIQRLGDLKNGRRSTRERIRKNITIQPTLKSAVPGDISLSYPYRVMENLMDGLEQLDRVIPGVASDSTLLYAPEIKFYSIKLKLSDVMETSVSDIYAIGDGAGVSRGITGASVSGLIAAEGIKRKYK